MQTKGEYTPGPWHVERVCEDGLEPHIWGVCHPGTICDATTVCNVFSEHDARLIAAAPDLLEALEEQIGECFDPSCEMCARHQSIIARAKGLPS